jgi:hypothetical protein
MVSGSGQDLLAAAPLGLCTIFLPLHLVHFLPAVVLAGQAALSLEVHSAALTFAQQESAPSLAPANAPKVNAATVIVRMIFFTFCLFVWFCRLVFRPFGRKFVQNIQSNAARRDGELTGETLHSNR